MSNIEELESCYSLIKEFLILLFILIIYIQVDKVDICIDIKRIIDFIFLVFFALSILNRYYIRRYSDKFIFDRFLLLVIFIAISQHFSNTLKIFEQTDIVYLVIMGLNLAILRLIDSFPTDVNSLPDKIRFLKIIRIWRSKLKEEKYENYDKIIKCIIISTIILINYILICKIIKIPNPSFWEKVFTVLFIIYFVLINASKSYSYNYLFNKVLIKITAIIIIIWLIMSLSPLLLIILSISDLSILFQSFIIFSLANLFIYLELNDVKKNVNYTEKDVMDLIHVFKLILLLLTVMILALSIKNQNIVILELIMILSYGTVIPWLEYIFKSDNNISE